MKKLIAFAVLAALVAGTVFAQTTINPYGRIRTNFGVIAPFGDDNTNKENQWLFAPTARLGLRGGNDLVSFMAQADFNNRNVLGNIRANATVKIGDSFKLSMGQNELPWVQWSSLLLYGDQNDGFGASTSTIDPYIRADFAGFYAGINSGNFFNGGHDLSKEGNNATSGRIVTDDPTKRAYPAPGFFLGYDNTFEVDDGKVSVGAAFAGLSSTQSLGPDGNKEHKDILSWMGNAHAKFNFDPVVIGVNVSFYGAPEFGFFKLSTGGPAIQNGKDAMVLEAMLDASVKLDPCTIGLTGAVIANMAEGKLDDVTKQPVVDGDVVKDGGGAALRVGLSFTFDLGGGLRLIPGLMYTQFLKDKGGVDIDNSNMQSGITLLYQF